VGILLQGKFGPDQQRGWVQEPPKLKNENFVKSCSLVTVFALQGQHYKTIEAKFGKVEYTAGILAHAKFGPDR